jgi:hypothetical protein
VISGPIDQQSFVCSVWRSNEVISTLIAIKYEDTFVPVVETYSILPQQRKTRILHLTGGTGGNLLALYPSVDPDLRTKIETWGGSVGPDFTDLPYMELLSLGHTIASVGYWGTTVRTSGSKAEIEDAIKDVEAAYEFYSASDEQAPAIVAESLGAHLALGAIGRERLQQANFIFVSPSMDGIQHALTAFDRERLKKLERKEFYVYRRNEGGWKFESVQNFGLAEHIRTYVGGKDLPLTKLKPKTPCSKVFVGMDDYRLQNFLSNKDKFGDYIRILGGRHRLIQENPVEMAEYFREFSKCLSLN